MKNDEFELKVEEFDKKRAEVTKKATSMIPSIVLALILLCMTSISTMVQFNFDIRDVVFSSVAISIALRMMMIICSKYIGADARYQKGQSGEDVLTAKREYMQMAERIDLSNFDDWIVRRNEKEKRQAWIDRQGRKLMKMDRKIYALNSRQIIRYSKFTARRIDKMKAKYKETEKTMEESYLNKNIGNIKVKFQKLRAVDFYCPPESPTSGKQKYSMSEARENAADILRGMPITLFVMMIGSLVSYNAILGYVNIVSITFDILTVSMNLSSGWFVTGQKTLSTLISVYTGRKAIIAQYLRDTEQ